MSGVGLSNKTLNLQYLNISVGDSIWLFITGGLIMLLIGLYLEFVLPKTYGKRRHPLFFIFC
jgi:pilus assembly protein TadC